MKYYREKEYRVIANSKNHKKGIVDMQGNIVCPFIYSYISETKEKGYREAEYEGKWVLLNNMGQQITSKTYDYIDFFYEGYAKVLFLNKWGFIDERGTEICEIKYDYANHFRYGYAKVTLQGENLYIDVNGKEIF